MSPLNFLLYFIYFPLLIADPELTLHYTEWVSENNDVVQHDCLRVRTYYGISLSGYQLISYCLSENPSKFLVENENVFPKFTFLELSEENISSQQLYLWSAPIDLVEYYQLYLNQLSAADNSPLAEKVFYNCTWSSRFGPMCQYELISHHSNYSSLNELIKNFYNNYDYSAITTLTCYTHLQCNRGPHPACLTWMEICDGKIDCLDGGFDEVDCWQLEMNECKDEEFRCRNGQCIPRSFYRDLGGGPDCTDVSDEPYISTNLIRFCKQNDEPSFACEDLLPQDPAELHHYFQKRKEILMKTMYLGPNSSISQECLSALKCLLESTDSEYSSCETLCYSGRCMDIVENNCSEMFYFPEVPILFGEIYFAYRKDDLQQPTSFRMKPFYVCYNPSRYNNFLVDAIKMVSSNNMICADSKRFVPPWLFYSSSVEQLHMISISIFHGHFQRYHLIYNYTLEMCNRSNMYQCDHSSKCISISRLKDNAYDCPYNDDQNDIFINTTDVMKLKQLEKTHFKCEIFGTYISRSLFKNGQCQCPNDFNTWCEDEDEHIKYLKTNIVFQHICDEFIDQLPMSIIDRNETDETECEQWECNNTYTRCNGVWNCLNGADEAGCVSYSSINCSSKEHFCILPNTNQLTCLPVEKANDGNVDCVGATDEPQLCGTKFPQNPPMFGFEGKFYCINQSFEPCIGYIQLCDEFSLCEDGADEQFCSKQTFGHSCNIDQYDDYLFSDAYRFLCSHRFFSKDMELTHFTLDGMRQLTENQEKEIENTMIQSSSIVDISNEHQPRCHRGLDLRVWLNNHDNSIRTTCLCPPSYYGSQCQYQNQRVSLTIKFQALASSRQTLFAIVISLIDDSDQRIIHSSEQLTFLSIRDCQTKFNIYLLYSTRPKDPSKNYSIHIDIYEKVKLTYRGSLLFPITFSFLPVYRLSLIVTLPLSNNKTRSCSTKQCNHGQCIKYSSNEQNVTFCKCDEGWSGQYCNIPHTCNCSLGSLCIGISSYNRSICVCPIHKFGPRCLLFDSACRVDDNSTCKNGGECISNDDYVASNQKFTCICRQGFSGDRCQTMIEHNNITLSFGKDIVPSQSIFIHFIEVIGMRNEPVRSTTFKTVPVKQDSVIIYWRQPFHLIFIEFFHKTYYLAVEQKVYNRSSTITKLINPSDRCPHISELLNETLIQLHLLRRIKYYHLPCQTYSPDLQCFYDEVHLCLCYNFGEKRLSNCLLFNHSMTFDCLGQSECGNGGQCIQDKPDCPERSTCICPSCFYGTRCQFSTSGFGLSLDAILGYHILSHLHFVDQPVIIQVSLALTIIFFVVGLINGILSLMTFKNKSVRQVGCGLYLFGSSITTLLITIMVALKFVILILTQMTIISNRSFLSFECHSTDFILRVCLCLDQWLNVCVAIERTITVVEGASFSKKKSKQAAKIVIIVLLIITIGTCIHDPIHRRLIDEENNDDDNSQKRTWCIINYSSGMEIYNYIIHILHFLGPFLINIISAVVLITKQSRRKAAIHNQRPYKELVWEQCRECKHLLIAPVVLVILAVPRLILSFVSKCMQSANDSWLFLAGYFISFIPALLTFVVFVVPSESYKKKFNKSIRQVRKTVQQRLHLI